MGFKGVQDRAMVSQAPRMYLANLPTKRTIVLSKFASFLCFAMLNARQSVIVTHAPILLFVFVLFPFTSLRRTFTLGPLQCILSRLPALQFVVQTKHLIHSPYHTSQYTHITIYRTPTQSTMCQTPNRPTRFLAPSPCPASHPSNHPTIPTHSLLIDSRACDT